MKIQLGKVVMGKIEDEDITIVDMQKGEQQVVKPNKTKRYLLPSLQSYGKTFMIKIQSVWKVAVGIGDAIIINKGVKHERHIYVLIDTTVATPFFVDFIGWIRNQPMYEDDYVYGDIQRSNFHMVIIKLPEEMYEAFGKFKLGKYSEMYSKEDVDKYFSKNPKSLWVLIKDHNYRIGFTKALNLQWGTSIKPEEYTGELDTKPTDDTELFNKHLKKD